MSNAMDLQKQVDEQRKTIRTDGYPMSIGEIAAMYRDRELELHPEFQRYFRWSPEQKSRLIESLLLGIPIPSFFVHQRHDGVWDVVDGLQRLSAIFEVMGILRDETEKELPQLQMVGTRYLPELAEKYWDPEDDDLGIGESMRRLIKRSKLDFRIVLRESDPETRLELFQRLNTGGTQLSSQELRNCQILMVEPTVLERIRNLSALAEFQDVIALSDRNIEEQYDVELVVRFIALRRREPEGLGALGPLLDDEIIRAAKDANFDWAREQAVFERTFRHLQTSLGSNAFRRRRAATGSYVGGFVVSLFEIFALGVGHWMDKREVSADEIRLAHLRLWEDEDILTQFRGRQAGDRLRTTLPMGRELFRLR